MQDESSYPLLKQQTFARFGDNFWKDHARQLVRDPAIALVEIIANCWDAGADTVKIIWPSQIGGEISIEDNGTGMTQQEFLSIWRELNYSRSKAHGKNVKFPPGNQESQRKAFGQNGKGRHSMFCFSDKYHVATWKAGELNEFQVTQTTGDNPFSIVTTSTSEHDGHGTKISGVVEMNYIRLETLRDLIGSKFVSDPGFRIFLNDELIELMDLTHLSVVETVEIGRLGTVKISRFDSKSTGRTSHQHGVAWWVNGRSVGQTSWRSIGGDSFIDARSSEAKRFTFIIEADILADDVLFDWTGFEKTNTAKAVIEKVNQRIQTLLDRIFYESRRERKKQAIQDSRESLKHLPISSRKLIGEFIDQVQSEAPTIGQEQLSATVSVLSKLEEARTGYKLLSQLAELSIDDMDSLSELLERWTIRDAQIVLDELYRRLKLIEKLEKVVEVHSDELHAIHPLIVEGLWIFGPEYEAISYTSNRSLATVVAKLLGDHDFTPSDGSRRPDIVVLPEAHLRVFSADKYDERGEVDGLSKVLVVELKKGSFDIKPKELHQAESYANELRKSGKVSAATEIVCYVLGTTLHQDASEHRTVGTQIHIYPRTYSTLLRQAHTRTFNLHKKIEEARKPLETDIDIEEVLDRPISQRMF